MRRIAYDRYFWLKTYLYKIIPGGYGYYRFLRQYADAEYNFERDKHPVRHTHNSQGGWKHTKEGHFIYRDYTDYNEYVTHQKQKFNEILKLQGGFDRKIVTKYRRKFYLRFKYLHTILPFTASILCLGARQGTEVEVLRDLGFKNAWGIDLNPGPNNPYVREGDFMNLDNPTSSIDLIYTNCIDHAFNLEIFFSEHARVIKKDGYALYDFLMPSPPRSNEHSPQLEGAAFESVIWENERDIFLMMLQHFKQVVHVESGRKWKWVLMLGKFEG